MVCVWCVGSSNTVGSGAQLTGVLWVVSGGAGSLQGFAAGRLQWRAWLTTVDVVKTLTVVAALTSGCSDMYSALWLVR